MYKIIYLFFTCISLNCRLMFVFPLIKISCKYSSLLICGLIHYLKEIYKFLFKCSCDIYFLACHSIDSVVITYNWRLHKICIIYQFNRMFSNREMCILYEICISISEALFEVYLVNCPSVETHTKLYYCQ